MPGKYFEDLEGRASTSATRQGRTITEMDNTLFCALTMNTQPLHLNEDFAAQHPVSGSASSTASSPWAWWSA